MRVHPRSEMHLSRYERALDIGLKGPSIGLRVTFLTGMRSRSRIRANRAGTFCPEPEPGADGTFCSKPEPESE